MRHPTTGALELQMDALLRSAADFEPELEAPFDLVERAMQRATRQIAVVRIQRPIVALLWGGAAGAAAASAAAAFLLAPPSAPTDPLETKQAAFGVATPGYRTTAEVEPDEPVQTHRRPTYRVRYSPRRVHLAASEGPVLRAAWHSEEVEQTIAHEVRPALQVQFDEQGQPVDLKAGLLETLTISENPSACGQPASGAAGPDEMDETTGASRAKEADLPSKED